MSNGIKYFGAGAYNTFKKFAQNVDVMISEQFSNKEPKIEHK